MIFTPFILALLPVVSFALTAGIVIALQRLSTDNS
jgi:hypothetical protein